MKNVNMLLFLLFCAFTIHAQVPDSPVLTEPPDVDIVVPTNITMDWENTPGATSYEIYISTDANFANPVGANFYVVASSSFQPPSGLLSSFTVYYWKVRGRNSFGPGEFSDTWSFRTAGTVSQEITSLYGVTQVIGSSNHLPPGQQNMLLQKLNHALNFYNNNHIVLSILNLQIYKLRIYILMFSNFLSNPDGERLIYNDNKIIDLIGGDKTRPEITAPAAFELKQNYPNPFNPSTAIEYTIPEDSRVSLKIYDILGKEVATLVDKEQIAGTYLVIWDAKLQSSGIYFYRITAGSYTETKRMVLKK